MFFLLFVAAIGLPLMLWGGGMLLYIALPHVVFWLLTIGLAAGVVGLFRLARSRK
jgi:hypothetical protein